MGMLKKFKKLIGAKNFIGEFRVVDGNFLA